MLPLLFSCHSRAELLPDTEPVPPELAETGDEDGGQVVIDLPEAGEALPVSAFGEVWAYVVAGRESALNRDLPISDVGYCFAEVDQYGALVNVPSRRKLPAFDGRAHLVAQCDSRSLSHFVLASASAERRALIADLIAAARDFDGLQIDFELVPQRDAAAFLSFLAELRSGLGGKIFSVALPARTRRIGSDVYDYEKISALADRVIVMAYDEHWSTSAPGPVASLPWCKRVADYALSVIGREKLVMGIPFYGRAWGNVTPSRALMYSGVDAIITENRINDIRRENGIPFFEYELPVKVRVYYDDDYSLSARMEMYRAMGVASIGFWRLGQETPSVWKILNLE
jgi:spore germination protein YaaH